MAPIRTALIGLSSNATTSWASSAHLPYLLSAAGKARFEIVALCNSSLDSAKRAIEVYGLPAQTTRAYGSPADLAADPDVQLVVVCTRVDQHYDTALPSVRAGKDVYVEWPLEENSARAGELARLASEKGGRSVVGLQGWLSPIPAKLRELIGGDRRIGKVLSSEVLASGGSLSRDILPVGLKYFADRKIGGSPFTIGFGHLFDLVQFTLGDIHNTQSVLQIQRPDVKIRDPSSGQIVETVKSDVPDLHNVTGTLAASETTAQGATLHIRYRRGSPFKGEPALVWTISGEKGEIRVVAAEGPGIQARGDPLTIQLHDFETDEVQDIAWDWGRWSDLPDVAKNIGALYDAYADGDATKYPDFQHALKRHTQLDEMLAKFDQASA